MERHIDTDDLEKSTGFSNSFHWSGKSAWREAKDDAGLIDIATVDINKCALPENAALHACGRDNFLPSDVTVAISSTMLTVGYPLGLRDLLHHLHDARRASHFPMVSGSRSGVPPDRYANASRL